MTLHIEYESQRELTFDYGQTARAVAEQVLKMEKCPLQAQVNLIVTDNEEIKRVNAEFRNIAAPTDVLSFPACDFETPGDFSAVAEDPACLDLDTGELVLGDIMISVDKVYEQAEAYGHSEKREFAFLVAHSMLHLTGYDHMTPEEAEVMESLQEDALAALGINRE